MISVSEAAEMNRPVKKYEMNTDDKIRRARQLLEEVNVLLLGIAKDDEYKVFPSIHECNDGPASQYELRIYKRDSSFVSDDA